MRKSGSSCGISLILGLLLILSPLTAKGQVTDEAERLRQFREQYERAGRAYNAQDYAGAIPALQAAYALRPLPKILFNIAQAYRRLDLYSSARVYFELYRSTDRELTAEMTTSVDRYIAEMDEREHSAAAPVVVEKTKLLYVQSERPPPRWLRPLGIAAGATGLGLLTPGVTFLGLDGRCTSPAEPPALACGQLYDTSVLGTALTAIGAGVLVLGGVTFGLSLKRPSKPTLREAPPTRDALPSLPSLQEVEPEIPTKGEPPPRGWNPDGTRARRRAVK